MIRNSVQKFFCLLLVMEILTIAISMSNRFPVNTTHIAITNRKKYYQQENNLGENYIVYGVLQTAVVNFEIVFKERSNQCLRDSKLLVEALDKKEFWALKVLDASGTPTSSFIYGQNFWVGSKTECERINSEFRINVINPKNANLSNQKSKFPLKYVMIFANYTQGYQYTAFGRQMPVLHIGLCLPASCSKNDIYRFAQEYFRNRILNIQRIYKLDLKIIEIRKQSWINFISRSETQILICLIFGNLFLVMLFNIFRSSEKSIIRKISECFDLNSNFRYLMSTATSPMNNLAAVDSLRFITCILIMGGHLIYFSTSFATNASEMVVASYKLNAQFFYLMPFLVDIFFHIGAMILVFNFLKNEKQILEIHENGILNNFVKFFKLLLNRYIRLTPGLLLTMLLSHLTALYLKDVSPYYISENQDLYCKGNFWWRNLLYIQGYFSTDDMCASWVWYLSADMQYYILTLFGLFIYAKGRKFTVTLSYIVLLTASNVYSFYLSSEQEYKFYLENFKKTENILYINPLVRIIPYLSGIFSGALLYSGMFSSFLVTYSAQIWLLCLFLIISCFSFGMIFRDFIPQIVFSAANSVVRFLFVQIFVGMIIYINYFKKAGNIGKFLSHNIFVHFSKLTYMMYLIEPIVIYLFRGCNEKPYNFSIFNLYVEFFGIFFLTYIASILCSLLFEIPYIKLSQRFLLKKK